jgi:hypothetical protein
LGGNEWIIDYLKRLGETLSKYAKEKLGRPIHLSYGHGYLGMALKAYPIMWKYGGLGPAGELFNGVLGARGEVDMEAAANWMHEHGCYCQQAIQDPTLENGPISAIEEEVKELCEKHKHMPKFFPVGVPPYWTPPAHADACIKALKKYGRYE